MLSFVAAVKVAQWVARAYGYRALKRREYVDVSTSVLGKWVRILKNSKLEKFFWENNSSQNNLPINLIYYFPIIF